MPPALQLAPDHSSLREVHFPFPIAPAAPEADPPLATVLTCRALNLLVAILLLVLTAPLMLLVALAVKLTSRGPVLYTQTRVGIDRRGGRRPGPSVRRRVDHGGRLFTIYKFRTMRVQTNPVEVWATPNDARITPLGRFLRKYRVDELPQLWNVLRGDMNVVGPRPEQPNIALALGEQIADYSRRHRVLPGITGLAQISQAYDTTIQDVRSKIRYDLRYIADLSPLLDLRIVLHTIPVVLLRRGGW